MDPTMEKIARLRAARFARDAQQPSSKPTSNTKKVLTYRDLLEQAEQDITSTCPKRFAEAFMLLLLRVQ